MVNFAVWLKGLAAALLGGAAAAVAQTAAAGNVAPANVKTAAIAGAGVTLAAYLTQSPIKPAGK